MKERKFTLQLDDMRIPCILQYKAVKNITLRVKEDGVHISAPYGTSLSYIEELVTSKTAWLIRAEERREKRTHVQSLNDTLTLWGKEYPLYYKEGSKRIVFSEAYVTVYYPSEQYQNYLKAELKKILKKQVEILRVRYDSIMDEYHLNRPEIHYREMTSRWGSCQPSKGVITMNTRLVFYPQKCLDYVLLHEYMHFIEPNHSKSFHNLLAYYMPDYKDREKILNK